MSSAEETRAETSFQHGSVTAGSGAQLTEGPIDVGRLSLARCFVAGCGFCCAEASCLQCAPLPRLGNALRCMCVCMCVFVCGSEVAAGGICCSRTNLAREIVKRENNTDRGAVCRQVQSRGYLIAVSSVAIDFPWISDDKAAKNIEINNRQA